jgi:NADPH-dependent 2,4-dienoyl-CoA reductase/sulfur reductase-like enzyme
MRSLEDSKTIRERAEAVKRAVVIGGGFIAMEVAAVLAQKGIEVTMVLREERIWSRIFSRCRSFLRAITRLEVCASVSGRGSRLTRL